MILVIDIEFNQAKQVRRYDTHEEALVVVKAAYREKVKAAHLDATEKCINTLVNRGVGSTGWASFTHSYGQTIIEVDL